MNLRELQEQRSATVAAMRAIVTQAETEHRDLSADETARFDTLKAEAAKVEANIQRQATLDELERRATGTPITGTGDSNFDTELRKFSLVTAIAHASGLNVDAGREREISLELERRSGRKAQGVMVPMSCLEKRVLTSTLPADTPGSNIISTDHRGDLYIDRLRNRLVVRQLGARIISGLVGNIEIPRLTTSATTGFVAENTALTASDPGFDKVSLTPKHAGGIVEMSRNMLQQSSPDVESLVRDDFSKLLAEVVDRVAIVGGGLNEPTGILATSGIGSVAIGTNGGALTWNAVNDLMAQLETDNADEGTLAFITNSKVRNAARKTLKVSGDASAGFIWSEPTMLAGYTAAVTNLVPSNLTKGEGTSLSALLYGNFNDLIIGYWSELDLLVNPYESTAYAKGNVSVRAMMTLDLAVRHTESFAAIKDITTA